MQDFVEKDVGNICSPSDFALTQRVFPREVSGQIVYEGFHSCVGLLLHVVREHVTPSDNQIKPRPVRLPRTGDLQFTVRDNERGLISWKMQCFKVAKWTRFVSDSTP